ncbi:MAG: YggS family pyridoxal phosphate-dependent enzyme [Saccharofermentanaceae bacterium]|jgi:hypothetical protein|nr:YggS family pyridoxal phosphate-dependent enzyme [Clostridia bacterium]NLX69160.1 YggS family pyridoxal phosphate-dependent enzyme [Clostridiaceae bacterium]HOO49053.1 YggS family pyridoxal phosphate-dependent enzyme [Saccharofermentans sp.]HPE28453.1 YggS family pyridoxal phosphate-dependent enzyme [Saccharofermentans sp.]HPG64409.1 YggS family pyridoxal phosphate-dependent enzyme [Saccharofermentans sp.]
MSNVELIGSEFNEDIVRGFEQRIAEVKGSIANSCKKAGRDVGCITLIGVSKVFPVSYAKAAYLAGLRDFGENRVQELVSKIEELNKCDMRPNWHLIGSLQKNKVKYIVGKTHLIHSVDTVDLAREISRKSVANGVVTSILLEANISGEESKHGFRENELNAAIDDICTLDGLKLKGLMTMAPIQSIHGDARPVFSRTKKVFDSLKGYVKAPNEWDTLSMGMSQDYDIAIEEGSTIVRIGTSIFGDRSKLPQ